jgi:small subunit ribosomal protein S18
MAQEPKNQSEEVKDERKQPSFRPSGPSRQSRSSSTRVVRQQRRPGQYNRRGRFHRRKVCLFCADKSKEINWKKLDDLRRFVGVNGSMYPRRKSGLCAKHQRRVAVAIKRARHLALMPYTTEHVRLMRKG